jgi:diphthamide biosynthesis protein 2
MEDIFSANTDNIIQKSIECHQFEINLNQNSETFDFYFDTDKTCEWIEKNSFKKIALQFPDELLNNAVNVCARLKQKCPNNIFFILADTSYGR